MIVIYEKNSCIIFPVRWDKWQQVKPLNRSKSTIGIYYKSKDKACK